MSDLPGELGSLLGEENILTDPASLLAYSSAPNFAGSPQAAIVPIAIARPVRLDQLAPLLRHCSQAKAPLAIRGAATAPCANSQPVVDGTIVLELTGLNRILDMDRENRVAHVQAGVAFQALQEAVAAVGLFYPITAIPVSTIGGNIAMNIAGGSSLKYGSAGDWIQELEVYTTAGERIICARQTSQLAAGFPLAPLFCGSAGCLGVIASCKLRLLPLPETTGRMLFSFGEENQAAVALRRIMTMPFLPTDLVFYNAACVELLGISVDGASCLLACSFDGSDCEVRSALELARTLSRDGNEEQAIIPPDPLPVLARGGRRFALEILQAPASRFPRLIEGIGVICQRHGCEYAIFGSPCRLHVALFIDEDKADLAPVRRDLFVFELMLNERLGSETEAELGREEWQQKQELVQLSSKLRPIFDPQGLLAAHPLPGARQTVL